MKYPPYMLHTENPSKIHLYEIMKYEMMKCDAQRVLTYFNIMRPQKFSHQLIAGPNNYIIFAPERTKSKKLSHDKDQCCASFRVCPPNR